MPHRRGVQRAGLFLLILGMLLTCIVVYLTRPRRLADLAGNYLTALSGAKAHIEKAWIRLDGTIELQNVKLTIPGMNQNDQLFEVQTVVIQHHILSLLQGRFEARNLTFFKPVMYLTQDLKTGRFNYQSLQAVRQASTSPVNSKKKTRIPESLPNIFIRNGKIMLGELEDGQYELLNAPIFNGSFSSDNIHRNLYYFSLRQDQRQDNLRPFLAGYLDVRTLAVEVSLKGFAFDDPMMRNFMPSKIRQWWDQLAPTGKVPNVRIGYDPDPDVGLFGVLDVNDIALTLPYTEEKSRMTVRSGRFKVSGDQIKIEKLIGEIEGFTYQINGNVNGLHPDAPFTLTSKMTGKITSQPRYAPWFGKQVKKAFEDLKPSGDLQVNVLVKREQLNGPFSYQGSVDIRNASINHVAFPYPLSDVRGLIRFDDQQIKLINFRGLGPSGSHLTINCDLNLDPAIKPAVRAQVTGTDLPIDAYLYNALAPRHRSLLENLFSTDRYQNLTNEKTGVIASSSQNKQWSDQRQKLLITLNQDTTMTQQQKKNLTVELDVLNEYLKRPVFDLGGKTNLSLTLERELGKNVKAIIDAKYELKGVNVLLKSWPYPMQLSSGTFSLGPAGGKLNDAIMHGLNGGEAVIHGTMAWRIIEGKKKLVPEIKFTGTHFPIDDIALNALGPQGSKILKSLGLKATVDVAGMVLSHENGKAYPALQIRVREGSVTPFGGQYKIDNLAGYVAVQDKDVQITQITGKHDDATFSLEGIVPKIKPVDLTFVGENLSLIPQVLDLIPPSANKRDEAKRIIEPVNLTGKFDMDLKLFNHGNSSLWQSRLKLMPKILKAIFKEKPIVLTDIQGHVEVRGDQIQLQNIACHYGTGQATISGNVHFSKGNKPALELSFDAQNNELCSMTKAVLPQAVLNAIDALKLDGQYHLKQAKFIFKPKHKQDDSFYQFVGKLDLQNAVAMVGVPITQMKGTIDLQVLQQGHSKIPELKMKLEIDELRAAERLISPLKVFMDNHASGGKILFLKQFNGTCYNGLLHGQGQIALDHSAAHMFRLTLQNADYGPMIDPKSKVDLDNNVETLLRPTLSADLTLSGMEEKENTHRAGRGSIAIRNASIYRFPLTMSVVQLLNLTTPTASKFTDADIDFLVDGDIINFEHIEMISPTINIVGRGTMKYSDQSLNLDMYTRNPSAPNFGPVSEIFKMFKNELVGIKVTGTLEEPKTNLKTLGGIKQTMSEILGKSSSPKANGKLDRASQATSQN